MYEGLVNNLRKAADEWEKKHPFIAFGELRVHDALRDAARALKEADDTLERVTLERDAAVADLTELARNDSKSHCEYCKHFDDDYCPTCYRTNNEGFEWRGVKENKPNIIELLQADNTKELLEKIEQLIIERDEAYGAICDHCMDPCQESECYWYRKMNQTEETKS